MLPILPCEQSLAETEKDVPIDERVADILLAIIPLFPTPQNYFRLTVYYSIYSPIKIFIQSFF